MMMVIPETRRPHLIIYLHFHFTSIFRHLKMVIYNRKNEIELNKLFHIKYQNKIGTSLSFILLLYRRQDCYALYFMSYTTGALFHPRFLGGVRVAHLLWGEGVSSLCVCFFYLICLRSVSYIKCCLCL